MTPISMFPQDPSSQLTAEDPGAEQEAGMVACSPQRIRANFMDSAQQTETHDP
jgi:hypothetical protein